MSPRLLAMLSGDWLQPIQPVISVTFTGHSLIHIWKQWTLKSAAKRVRFSICRQSPGVFVALSSKALIKERKAHDWACWLRASVERGEVKKKKAGGWKAFNGFARCLLLKCIMKIHSAIVENNHSVTQRNMQTERILAGQAIALSHEHTLITRGKKQATPCPGGKLTWCLRWFRLSLCIFTWAEVQSPSLSWLASFVRIDLKGMKENGKGATT